MCSPLPEHDFSNRASACQTRLAFPSVDLMHLLKPAAVPVGVHIIGNRRAALCDSRAKHLADGFKQPLRPRWRQPARRRPRMNARRKQTFIRINIADSRHKRLIEQQRLDAPAMGAQTLLELFQADRERIRRAVPARRQLAQIFESPELARIVENQNSVLKFHQRACMLARPAAPQQFSRHAQMSINRSPVELDENLLAQPPDAQDPASRQRLRRPPQTAPRDQFRKTLRAHNPAPRQYRRQRTDYGFNFGQFRQDFLRQIGEYIAAFYADRKGRHPHVFVEVVLAGAAIKFPPVPRANDMVSVQIALAERPARMRARTLQAINLAIHVANGVNPAVLLNLDHRAGLKLAGRSKFHPCHISTILSGDFPRPHPTLFPAMTARNVYAFCSEQTSQHVKVIHEE
jgi:hypothetical protein